MQQSLFPDAVQILSTGLSTLRDLDLPRARAFLERVRRLDHKAVNLRVLDEALELLERVLESASPTPDHLAEVMALAGRESLAGRLNRPAADFVDETVACYCRRHGSAADFVDDEARLHRGVLDLIRGDAVAAWRHLSASLAGGHGDRADLWGYRGDAACELGRTGEVSACYVRGLLLSAGSTGEVFGVGQVDLSRCRLQPLVRTYQTLCRRYPEDCARELLLVHAWLEGLLTIPAQNGWLDERKFGGPVGPAAAPRERYRRFARLLYSNRSLPRGSVGMAQREEMAGLDRVLFGQYMDRRRELEG